MQEPDRRRPRAPGVLYGGLSLAFVVLVAAVALFAQQPPPPTISEFAPQALEQITEAPGEQAARFGAGAPPTPTPTPQPGTNESGAIDQSRVRECVGDPPRQIEDPQSPPCVPYWEGDNGGSTWQGVTSNQINIVVPANKGFIPHYETFFNERFEFYGRKVKLIETGGETTTTGMQAAAVEADETHQAFASTMYGDAEGREFVYYEELARRQIVSVNGRPTGYGEEYLRGQHPYQWSYLPGHTEMSVAKAEWACRSLKDKVAQFAGGAERTRPRKFALIVSEPKEGSPPDTGPMKRILASCAIELAIERGFDRTGEDEQKFARARNIIAELQTNNVTTILCQCHTGDSGYYLGYTATSQGYQPEWLISTYMYQAEDTHAQAWEPSQVDHSFGLSWWSKQLRPEDSPWWWPVRAYDPGLPGNQGHYLNARWLYNGLLMLASGIQMAGPNLTPETFAEGLQKTNFPNPDCGRPPWYQGCVSFRNDHTAIDDAAIIWLSSTEQSNWGSSYRGGGAMCHAKSGLRYTPGSLANWPSDYAGLFQRPCY